MRFLCLFKVSSVAYPKAGNYQSYGDAYTAHSVFPWVVEQGGAYGEG